MKHVLTLTQCGHLPQARCYCSSSIDCIHTSLLSHVPNPPLFHLVYSIDKIAYSDLLTLQILMCNLRKHRSLNSLLNQRGINRYYIKGVSRIINGWNLKQRTCCPGLDLDRMRVKAKVTKPMVAKLMVAKKMVVGNRSKYSPTTLKLISH